MIIGSSGIYVDVDVILIGGLCLVMGYFGKVLMMFLCFVFFLMMMIFVGLLVIGCWWIILEFLVGFSGWFLVCDFEDNYVFMICEVL